MHGKSDVPTGQAGRSRAPSDLASLEQKIRDLAKPRPIYTPKSVRPAHALRYDWTGWLSNGHPFPPTTCEVIRQTAPSWAEDGLQLGEFRVNGDRAQILFTTTPQVSPVFCAARVKGRLQHALRQAGTPVKFSRKVSFRSLGENIRGAVEGYLGKQVRKEGFVDPRFVKRIEEYTIERPDVDLAQPIATNSGRYWYNLHLVLVVGGRRRIADYGMLAKIRDTALRIADKKGYRLKSVSVMPDHVHAALGGDIEQSPDEIALAFLNNLAFALGQNRVWQDGYYVGTFSEYDLKVLRRLAEQSESPAAQGRRGTSHICPCNEGRRGTDATGLRGESPRGTLSATGVSGQSRGGRGSPTGLSGR